MKIEKEQKNLKNSWPMKKMTKEMPKEFRIFSFFSIRIQSKKKKRTVKSNVQK